MYVAQPIEWTDRGVVMLDQRRLPSQEIHHTYTDYREVAKAIREMVIRGAPAIGVAAAMGAALGVLHSPAKSIQELRTEFTNICDLLAKTRPTAVDLFWAIDRMKARFTELTTQSSDLNKIQEGMVAEGVQQAGRKAHQYDIEEQRAHAHPKTGARHGGGDLRRRVGRRSWGHVRWRG